MAELEAEQAAKEEVEAKKAAAATMEEDTEMPDDDEQGVTIDQVLAEMPEAESEQTRATAKRAMEAFVLVQRKSKKVRTADPAAAAGAGRPASS